MGVVSHGNGLSPGARGQREEKGAQEQDWRLYHEEGRVRRKNLPKGKGEGIREKGPRGQDASSKPRGQSVLTGTRAVGAQIASQCARNCWRLG